MQTWALILDSFRDALDRKLFWVMLAISFVIAIAMAGIGFDDEGISVLFGTWHWDSPETALGSPMRQAILGAVVVKYIGDLYLGWIGIVLALIATAGVFPALIEKGSIDVVLSKPLSRAHVFLGKYLGSMVFVLLQATAFVGLTFLVLGFRWHLWLWAYWWSVPLFVVLFSYVYCFTALFGVLTRSAMTSLLLTMVAWVVIFIPQSVYETFEVLPQLSERSGWKRGVAVVRWIVPKTQDIPYIAGNLIDAGTATELLVDPDNPMLTSQDREQLRASVEAERRLSDVSIVKSIGSSLLFEAVIVLFAVWKFARKDF